MIEDLRALTVTMSGHDGHEIHGYFAEPLDDGSYGGAVVIHHLPGYDEESREITRKLAAHGYLAVCPNLYSRESPGLSEEEAAAKVREAGGVSDDRLVGDIAGAVAFLKSQDRSNSKVATIGYCSGGRQSLLAACNLELDAAVDCYGAFVLSTPPAQLGLTNLGPITDQLARLSCPLLGLFGAEDQFPSPEDTAQLEKLLVEHQKEFEFHTYEGAGHAFFSTNRPMYRPEAAKEGWKEVFAFFSRYLS
jgi:carboxymethylenebutenolidase